MDRSPASAPTLIGTAEAARILGLHRGHVSKLAQRGVLPPVAEMDGRTGARVFDRADVEAYKAARAAS